MTAFGSPATNLKEICERGSVATGRRVEIVAISKCLELSFKVHFEIFFNVKEALQWVYRWLVLRCWIPREGLAALDFLISPQC